jgi:DNA-binding transcriptional ArsR family regulator
VDDDLDKVFKALADPARRLLLDRLREENGQTLTRLHEHLAMSRQAAAKHLGVLEAAALVVPIWRGREKLHYLNPVPIHAIADRWIAQFERGRLRALADLKRRLEEEEETDG